MKNIQHRSLLAPALIAVSCCLGLSTGSSAATSCPTGSVAYNGSKSLSGCSIADKVEYAVPSTVGDYVQELKGSTVRGVAAFIRFSGYSTNPQKEGRHVINVLNNDFSDSCTLFISGFFPNNSAITIKGNTAALNVNRTYPSYASPLSFVTFKDATFYFTQVNSHSTVTVEDNNVTVGNVVRATPFSFTVDGFTGVALTVRRNRVTTDSGVEPTVLAFHIKRVTLGRDSIVNVSENTGVIAYRPEWRMSSFLPRPGAFMSIEYFILTLATAEFAGNSLTNLIHTTFFMYSTSPTIFVGSTLTVRGNSVKGVMGTGPTSPAIFQFSEFTLKAAGGREGKAVFSENVLEVGMATAAFKFWDRLRTECEKCRIYISGNVVKSLAGTFIFFPTTQVWKPYFGSIVIRSNIFNCSTAVIGVYAGSYAPPPVELCLDNYFGKPPVLFSAGSMITATQVPDAGIRNSIRVHAAGTGFCSADALLPPTPAPTTSQAPAPTTTAHAAPTAPSPPPGVITTANVAPTAQGVLTTAVPTTNASTSGAGVSPSAVALVATMAAVLAFFAPCLDSPLC